MLRESYFGKGDVSRKIFVRSGSVIKKVFDDKDATWISKGFKPNGLLVQKLAKAMSFGRCHGGQETGEYEK